MSLKSLESVALNTFLQTGAFTAGNWHYQTSIKQEPPENSAVYLDRLGKFLIGGARQDSPGVFVQVKLLLEAGLADNTSPQSFPVVTSEATIYLAVGEWDKVGNAQTIYSGVNPPNAIDVLNPVTYTLTGTTPYSGLFTWLASNTAIGTIGGWDNTARGEFVFFETWGFAIRACANVRHTDSSLYRGLALIDLTTGDATLLDVPTFYTNTPAALFEAPEVNQDSFTLSRIQFVPDDDSALGAPKGRIFLSSHEFLSTAGQVDNTDQRQYLKVIEWNPLAAVPLPGNPNRVHLRELQFSQVDKIGRQDLGTNPNSLGDFNLGGSGNAVGGWPMRFEPLSRTLVTFADQVFQDFFNDTGYVRHSLVSELSQIDQPTPLAEIETNKTVTFRTRGLGSLGDPVAGVAATWTLERFSTLDEPLDTSAAPASNFVANPAIDDAPAVGSEHLVVKLNGTPLTVTTDYTVNRATGEITWAGTHAPPATSGYTASYNHSNTAASPPHGTLLQAATTTDDFGVAESRVQYADDATLEDQLDRISVSVSDD